MKSHKDVKYINVYLAAECNPQRRAGDWDLPAFPGASTYSITYNSEKFKYGTLTPLCIFRIKKITEKGY